MKILVAPDSFKGTLKAKEVAEIIEKGIRKVFPEAKVIKVPLADGGEGTVEALVESAGGKTFTKEVASPLGEKVKASFAVLSEGSTAIIEMAQASGFSLVTPEKRNPLWTTTFGTGELIKSALDEGCKKIIIGIGGSATVDGGAGMAQALGAQILDKEGKEIGFGGGNLGKTARINMEHFDFRAKNVKVIVASDVDNPLCGERGAAKVYGPQKGANKEMVEILEENLVHFARIVKKFLNKDVKDIPGAGAAGGLGAGLVAFMNAEIKPGIEIIIQASHLEEKMKGVDLVISGEGRIDEQTLYGKVPVGVLKIAKKRNIPLILIGGEVREKRLLYKEGISAIISCVDRIISLEEALKGARVNLMNASEQAMRFIELGCFLR